MRKSSPGPALQLWEARRSEAAPTGPSFQARDGSEKEPGSGRKWAPLESVVTVQGGVSPEASCELTFLPCGFLLQETGVSWALGQRDRRDPLWGGCWLLSVCPSLLPSGECLLPQACGLGGCP